jgi:STE24 endopeptidase
MFTSCANNLTKKFSSRSSPSFARILIALCVAIVACGVAAQAQLVLSAPVGALVDAQRQHLAEAVNARKPPLFFASAFLEIGALLWMWRAGRAAALRDALRRRFRNVHVLRLTYVWSLAMIAQIAALPAAIVSYRLLVAAGISQQSPAEWLGASLSSAFATAVMAAVIFAFMLMLASRTRLWYVFGALFLVFFIMFAAFAEPVVFAPWLHHQQPLGNSPLATRLYTVEHTFGIRAPIIVEDDGTGTGADLARVAGLGPTQQIVVSNELLETASPGELAFLIARFSAHIAAHDNLKLDLYVALWLIVAAALSVTLADRIGFRRDDDPLSRLALLGTFLGLAILLLLPVQAAYSRRLEARADHAAVLAMQDPASAVRLMVRFADADLVELCPSPIIRRYFLNYPPIGSRIAAIRGGGDPCP